MRSAVETRWGALLNVTSVASHSSETMNVCRVIIPKDLGFATQDRSWCAFVGDFKTTY
jgi:hypothetical protein